MFKKLKKVSLITLTIASILWSFNYVIGPVTSFHFSIIGFLLLLINYVWGLFKVENRIEDSIVFFLVFVLIFFTYSIEIGPIKAKHILLFIFTPLILIYCFSKLKDK